MFLHSDLKEHFFLDLLSSELLIKNLICSINHNKNVFFFGVFFHKWQKNKKNQTDNRQFFLILKKGSLEKANHVILFKYDYRSSLTTVIINLKKCTHLISLLKNQMRSIQTFIFTAASFFARLITYHWYLPFFLTHTRTLTRALVLSQLQPSGTVALIGVQQSGAAMTAASIVNMTACYLFNTENRRVFGGVCVCVSSLLISVQQIHISARLCLDLYRCVHPHPAHGLVRTHSAKSLWCSRIPLHSHRCPDRIRSHLSTHTHRFRY